MFNSDSPPSSLCILRLSAIGDVTHVLPALRTFQHYWPETSVTWIIGSLEHTLVYDLPGVDFVVFDKSKGIKGFLELRSMLKHRRFDLLLNMQRSFRAGMCSRMIKSDYRMDFQDVLDTSRGGINGRRSNRPLAKQHVLDSLLDFPKSLGLEPALLRWDIPIPQSAREFALHHVPPYRGLLVLNPCTSSRLRNYRNWSVNSYAGIIDYAARKHQLHPVLTGGPAQEEAEYARAICAASSHPITNLVGLTTLKELTAVLNKARLVISPDTGAAHIGNALGKPVIGLYATSNPERTGPYLNLDITVNRYPQAVRAEYGKSPDELPWGKRVRDPRAMDLISVEDVEQRIDVALNAGSQ